MTCAGSSAPARRFGSSASATICRASRGRPSFKNASTRYSVFMSDCLFCRIISGEIKGSIVYEDDDVVAIKDINPQAPLHVLIVPREHVATINDLRPANDALLGSMFRAAPALA